MRALVLGLLLLTVTFVGCLGDAGDDDLPDQPDDPAALWAEEALPFGDDHDHEDPTQHAGLSTPNFREIGWDPLVTEHHGSTSGDHLCGEVATDGERDLAVTHSWGTDVALVVSDVTDPADPEKIGELVLPTTFTYDAGVTDDASYAVLGTVRTGQPDALPSLPPLAPTGQPVSPAEALQGATWRDSCGQETPVEVLLDQGPEDNVPYASGLVLVDLTDPTEPSVVDYMAMPTNGAHSVFVTTIDGTHHVLGGIANSEHTASYFEMATISQGATGPRLEHLALHTSEQVGPAPSGPLANGHVDGWIQEHPVTGEVLYHLANWNGGYRIISVDGPQETTVLFDWSDFDPEAGSGMTGQYHGTYPIEGTWEDRHYTFVGQEIVTHPTDRPSGQIVVFDTTDPAEAEPVARWTLPQDVEWSGGLQFSTHYFVVDEERRIGFVSMYHGGVWAFDADPANGPELETLGVFMPDHENPDRPAEGLATFTWAPTVLDVLQLPTGELVSWDATTGLYTFVFDETVELPTPEPWTQDSWIEG